MGGLRHRSISAQGRSLSELVNMVRNGGFLLDTEYQRGDVWTESQQVALLKSFFLGVPVPAIIVNLRGDLKPWRDLYPDSGVHYACIDGKQRMLALMRWYGGQLRLPIEWFDEGDIVWESVPVGAMKVTFNNLTRPRQLNLKRMAIPFAVAQLPTLREEVEVYLLINRQGVDHTDAELARAQAVLDAQRSGS
jgi:hypothetical protein